MTEKNGNNAKHLVWLGGAIVICVTVAWGLDQEVKCWDKERHIELQNCLDRSHEELHEDISEIKSDVKELLKKIK